MARIEAPRGGGGSSLIDTADCPADLAVGDWVYISGAPQGGNYQVGRANPQEAQKVPAAGLVIAKLTTTTCRVQWGGKCKGVVSGLPPGSVLYVGASGKTVTTPDPVTPQPVGVSLGTDEILVAPDWTGVTTPEYASHLGTQDGATDARLTFPTGTAGYVAAPTSQGSPYRSLSSLEDWASLTAAHPCVRSSPVAAQTPGNVTELNPGTTLVATIWQYQSVGGVPVVVDSDSLACSGVDQVSAKGWIQTIGVVSNHGRFEGLVGISVPLATVLPLGGFVELEVAHMGASGGPYSVTWEAFYDGPYSTPPSPGAPTVAEGTAVLKYLSGIRYYDFGSQFVVSGAITDAFKACFHAQPVVLDVVELGVSGVTALSAQDPGLVPVHPPVPKWNDALVWTKTLSANTRGVRGYDARARHQGRDVWGISATGTSASGPIMVDTVLPSSTEVDEPFDDEAYRLVPQVSWTSAPAVPPGSPQKFVSTAVLDNSANRGAQVVNGELQYPVTDYLTPGTRRPVQQMGTNYSTMSGDREYQRVFRHDTSPNTRSNVVLYLPGFDVVAGDIAPGGSGAVNMYLYIPGVSPVWFDCGRQYFSSLFPLTEPGCLVKSLSGIAAGYPSNNYWYFTFGPYSTTPTDRVVICRVVLRNSSRVVSRILAYNWT